MESGPKGNRFHEGGQSVRDDTRHTGSPKIPLGNIQIEPSLLFLGRRREPKRDL